MSLINGGRPAAARLPHAARPWDRRALICFVLAALVLAGALLFTLSRSERHRAGSNGVFAQTTMTVPGGMAVCQDREVLPANATEVQIAGVSNAPPVLVLRRGGRVLESVEATVDHRTSTIAATIRAPGRVLTGVQVCLVLHGAAKLMRGATPPDVGSVRAGQTFAGNSLMVTYMSGERGSWWSFATTLARRICGEHADGSLCWVVWATLGLLVAALLLTGWIVTRALVLGRVSQRVVVAIAAVAFCNAAVWSFITPAFQVPDEAAHVAYVQAIGETGRPPADPPTLTVSREQAAAMADTGFGSVTAYTYRTSVWSRAQAGRLAHDLGLRLPRVQTIPMGEAEPEPPLYYALQAIPYRAAHDDTLLDRLMLMRLASALLAAVTALLSYLFVRECLPAKPWAWVVGGLCVALTPMLGFISGGVNPDGLVFALAAALFLCLARGWRRGVTPRLALGVGALLAAGMLTKVNFYGLVPGTLLGLTLAARRTTLAWDRRLLRLVGAATLLAAGLFVAGAAFESLAWHRSITAARPIAPESHVGPLSHLSYVWQVFLPRLPAMPATALLEPGYEQLFKSFVGAFGQMIVWFPGWVYTLVAAGAVAVGLLAVRMLAAEPRELRWRRGELVGYATMALALMLLIGLSADLRRNLIAIVQGRYLLPLLPLLGLLLALGARGAGERWGRTVGVALVAGMLGLGVFGQLLTIAWFYS